MQKDGKLLRVGILGCGPISQAAHFEPCRKSRNVELFPICDVADDLLEKMSLMHGVDKTFTDYDKMLADPGVEAVVIGIADQFHVSASLKHLKLESMF